MKNLIVRTITGLLYITIIILSLIFFEKNPIFWICLMTVCSGIGTWELLRMGKHIEGVRPQFILPILLALFLTSSPFFLLGPFDGEEWMIVFPVIILLTTLIPVVELFRKSIQPLHNISISVFALFWIAFPFCCLNAFAIVFPQIVLAFFIIIWLSDTIAYCAGSLFGKHRLCERISPKKSVEGFLISLILTVLIASAFSYIDYFNSDVDGSPVIWMTFALIVNLSGTCGDLIESMIKRHCGVKDSGKILPGHGGVLDRFDSSLLAAPIAMFFWLLMSSL